MQFIQLFLEYVKWDLHIYTSKWFPFQNITLSNLEMSHTVRISAVINKNLYISLKFIYTFYEKVWKQLSIEQII